MSEHERDVVRLVRTLDERITALPAGETRDTLKGVLNELIEALAVSGYTLRRGGPGYELPAA